MTIVYFVRHAQPDFSHDNDLTRPLTEGGREDALAVLGFFRDKHIDEFISSPYKRSYDTIFPTSEYFNMTIKTDFRLCERKKGKGGNSMKLIKERWSDKEFHEAGGESLSCVQIRNIDALRDILIEYEDKTVVVGSDYCLLRKIPLRCREWFGKFFLRDNHQYIATPIFIGFAHCSKFLQGVLGGFAVRVNKAENQRLVLCH